MAARKSTHTDLFPRILLLGAILALGPPFAGGQGKERAQPALDGAASLVRVAIVTEGRGAPESFVFDGRLISDYRPKILRFFPATGIVLDAKGHVLSYMGYRWIALQGANPRVEVVGLDGRKYPAKMIGIDQSLGVAVVRAEGAGLPVTPVCLRCEIRPEDTVVVPVFEKMIPVEYQSAKIVNVGVPEGMSGRGGWQVNLNRPLRDFGEPLLNRERQVLGFIAEKELFYPISQLLNSAEKVMRAGGDIRTGWLGVYVEVEEAQSSAQIAGAIRVSGVEEGGPASKAGLMPGDILKKWNGREVENAWDFIRNVQDTPVGSQAAVEVLRQGRPLTLTALIEARKPQPVQEKFVFSFPETSDSRPPAGMGVQALEIFGIDTVALTPKLARSLRLPVQSGLLVSDVELRQAFDIAGVQAGDVILLVDGRPVTSPAYFYSHMQSRGSGARLMLKLLRRGEERTTVIQLPSGPSARP